MYIVYDKDGNEIETFFDKYDLMDFLSLNEDCLDDFDLVWDPIDRDRPITHLDPWDFV